MRGHSGHAPKPSKKILLATIGILTIAASAAIGALKVPPLRALPQTAASAPTFEVASIKPNKSGETGFMFGIQRPGGRFTARNARLRELIRVAYQLQDFQIAGAPDWIGSARFDIEGKPEGDPQTGSDGVDPQWLMVRTLLADRFNLRVHNESRELPIYALISARTDGKLGPLLRSTEGGCKALVAERERGGPPPPPGAPFRCGLRRGTGAMTGRDRAMTQLASLLAPLVGRMVIDRTGLMENFDFDLSWTPDQIAPSPIGLPEPTQTSGPSIFTALQEQLGLKLDSTKGPVEVLVIDNVEQPTPD